MGFIRQLDANVDIQTFPGAKFELTGDVPAPQCSEAQIEGDSAITINADLKQLHDPGKFTGWDLTTKVCTITASVGGNTGDFAIASNTDGTLTLDPDPGEGNPVQYYIHDGGELILTRNVKSFAERLHLQGWQTLYRHAIRPTQRRLHDSF